MRIARHVEMATQAAGASTCSGSERQARAASASSTETSRSAAEISMRSPPRRPSSQRVDARLAGAATIASAASRRRRARSRPGPRRTARSRPSSRAARPGRPGRASIPTSPAIAISASAQARPPSLMSCAAVAPPARIRSPHEGESRGDRLDLGRGQPVGELAAELGQLRARQRGREGPDQDQLDRRRPRPEPAAPRRGRAARRPCRRQASGRSGRARSRCRARRCRRRPGRREPSRRRRAR